MLEGVNVGAAAVAGVIATLGLFWFVYVLKEVRRLAPLSRYGVYALVWLAYFVCVMLLATRVG